MNVVLIACVKANNVSNFTMQLLKKKYLPNTNIRYFTAVDWMLNILLDNLRLENFYALLDFLEISFLAVHITSKTY